MVVTFDADDIGEIEGGIPAVDNIAKTNLPADLTYALATVDESNATMTFTLTFASIDEYRTKVTNILKANANSELTPVIHYEKQQSVFKEGIKFHENFASADLLGWFKSAV